MKKKRYALITGASRGIGKKIATELIKLNIYVIGTATTEKGCIKIKKELKNFGTGIIINFLNIKKTIITLKKIIQKYIKIDILIHNSGIIKDNLLIKMNDLEWNQVIQINLSSIYYLSKFIVPKMISQKNGRIIIINSIIGETGQKGQTNYATSKSGLSGFVKSLALEIASRNITVNSISPGYIKTQMTKKIFKNPNKHISNIPVKRIGTPWDIAYTVLFLISPHASYITGQNIHVNGGLYMP